jgi:hypothetical protein
MNADKNKSLPLAETPSLDYAADGQPTPANVLQNIAEVASERKCINPSSRLVFDRRGRVVNRILNWWGSGV